MWIDRELRERVIESSEKFPAVLLTGARQTGKTSLLRHTFSDSEYFSFELPSNRARVMENPLEFLRQYRGRVIFDEVQNLPEITRFLKVVIDERRDLRGQFLLTGSEKFQLMQGVSESLAGRIAVMDLETLGFFEISELTSLEEYLVRGGFPELQANPDVPADTFFSSYFATYLERDVRRLGRITNLVPFESLVLALAHRAAQFLNYADVARDVGVSPTTVSDWIKILEASNQISLVPQFFLSFGKRLAKAPKIMFRDPGMLAFLLGLRHSADLFSSGLRGQVFENAVFNELLRAVGDVTVAGRIYCWRESNGVEVDFVIPDGDGATLVEAKFAEEPTAKDAANIVKVHETMRLPADAVHYVVCRSDVRFAIRKEPTVVALPFGEIAATFRSRRAVEPRPVN